MIARAVLPFTLRHNPRSSWCCLNTAAPRFCRRVRLNHLQICSRRSEIGRQGRTSLGAAQLSQATDRSGSAASAEIAGRIPRMRFLMSAAPAGMPRYAGAGAADGRARDLAACLMVSTIVKRLGNN